MSRGTKVHPDSIPKLKQALRRNGFPRQIDLAEAVGVSKNTAWNFLNGKPVDHLNFLELCNKLGYDWREVADLGENPETQNVPNVNPNSPPNPSAVGAGLDANATTSTVNPSTKPALTTPTKPTFNPPSPNNVGAGLDTNATTSTPNASTKPALTTPTNPKPTFNPPSPNNVGAGLDANATTSTVNASTKPALTTPKTRLITNQGFPTIPVWQGRDELLTRLTAKLRQPNTPLKVLALIGQGGIGKTSLAVKLLETLGIELSSRTPVTNCPYPLVIYFQVQPGTSFDDITEFLLRDGFGIETRESLQRSEEKIAKIIHGFAQQPCLFLLDNLETILHPANHPQARQAMSPEWGQFLNALVYQQHQCQTIITSRDIPADFTDPRYDNAEPDSELVHIETVTGVATKAGVEILRQRHLRDKIADLQWVSAKVEGHVFLLTQLAAVGKGKPGYLRKHPELVTKKAEPILREQLMRQNEAARDLLRRMCVLRVGIDCQGLTFLRLYQDNDSRFDYATFIEEPVEFTEEEIGETEAIIGQLVDSSLVQSRYDEENCEVLYDLHRVIVEFLQVDYKHELPKLWKIAYNFYSLVKKPDNPQTIEDLRPVLEYQHFAFKLGNYSEAYKILDNHLKKHLRRWGYWDLFKNLYEQLQPHVDEDTKAYCLMGIGEMYRDYGKLDQAQIYLQDALSIYQKQQNKSNIAKSLSMLGDLECIRYNSEEAERLYQNSLEIYRELGDQQGKAISYGQLGNIHKNRSNWEQAEQLYRQYLQIMEELDQCDEIATGYGCLADIESNRGNLNEAVRLYQQSLKLRIQSNNKLGIAESFGCMGHIQRAYGNYDEAEQLYQQALQIMTGLGKGDGIALGIYCLGANELAKGNLPKAESLLKDALTKMEKLEIKHYIAMVNYEFAKLERQRSNIDLAENYYNTAHQLFGQLGAVKDLDKMEQEWLSQDDS
ncbi:MAG: tetratricopeptide repeat protein [Coleofasciculus sp.]